MIQHGVAPFLECSSKGVKELSAFYARIKSRGNRSIEDLYQGAKVFADGSTGLSWKQAKGKKAVNQAEVTALYADLWREYIAENPHLLDLIRTARGLQDTFGQRGHCCQATELWRIRTDSLADRRSMTPPTDRQRHKQPHNPTAVPYGATHDPLAATRSTQRPTDMGSSLLARKLGIGRQHECLSTEAHAQGGKGD